MGIGRRSLKITQKGPLPSSDKRGGLTRIDSRAGAIFPPLSFHFRAHLDLMAGELEVTKGSPNGIVANRESYYTHRVRTGIMEYMLNKNNETASCCFAFSDTRVAPSMTFV